MKIYSQIGHVKNVNGFISAFYWRYNKQNSQEERSPCSKLTLQGMMMSPYLKSATKIYVIISISESFLASRFGKILEQYVIALASS